MSNTRREEKRTEERERNRKRDAPWIALQKKDTPAWYVAARLSSPAPKNVLAASQPPGQVPAQRRKPTQHAGQAATMLATAPPAHPQHEVR